MSLLAKQQEDQFLLTVTKTSPCGESLFRGSWTWPLPTQSPLVIPGTTSEQTPGTYSTARPDLIAKGRSTLSLNLCNASKQFTLLLKSQLEGITTPPPRIATQCLVLEAACGTSSLKVGTPGPHDPSEKQGQVFTCPGLMEAEKPGELGKAAHGAPGVAHGSRRGRAGHHTEPSILSERRRALAPRNRRRQPGRFPHYESSSTPTSLILKD